ncbi:hypothetical protein OE88DRAFT_1265307 [Heliocybe sulcata]|uniref:Uncharacterized protein n=1 Tax=Heliocybe sulcata TaxID=5364 RepID=A0A5C3NJ50_9AGAM|nr:hypothetical protein OE88DRAFT_1265307 [Heliocybe sulcata]
MDQLASIDQQQEILRYLRGLHEWLETDAFGRQRELRGTAAGMSELRYIPAPREDPSYYPARLTPITERNELDDIRTADAERGSRTRNTTPTPPSPPLNPRFIPQTFVPPLPQETLPQSGPIPSYPPAGRHAAQEGPVPSYQAVEPPDTYRPNPYLSNPYQSDRYPLNLDQPVLHQASPYPTQGHQATPWYGPYANVAAAAGLGGPGVYHFKPDGNWRPTWNFFQLMAYRGSQSTSIMIKPDWDDERLLKELSKTYNRLRSWRRVFSLQTFSSLVLVWADTNYIYPQPSRYTAAQSASAAFKNMRIRYYLRQPKALRGTTEFMQYLTKDQRYGVMYLERWDPYRITFLISAPVLGTLVFSILWAYFTGNISDAFTIGSYMVTAYSTFLVLIGILNWVEF